MFYHLYTSNFGSNICRYSILCRCTEHICLLASSTSHCFKLVNCTMCIARLLDCNLLCTASRISHHTADSHCSGYSMDCTNCNKYCFIRRILIGNTHSFMDYLGHPVNNFVLQYLVIYTTLHFRLVDLNFIYSKGSYHKMIVMD